MVFNYAQHIFPGGAKNVARGFAPVDTDLAGHFYIFFQMNKVKKLSNFQ